MGATKDLFSLMRLEETQIEGYFATKKEVVKQTTNFITNILDSGEYNIHELLSQSKRASESLEVINSEILKRLPQENFEEFGLKGMFRQGGEKLNFSEDEVVAELEKKLAQRKELLKLAFNRKEEFTVDGVYVPLVSSSQIKSSLSISF
jgi:hypothetical protein